MNLWAIVVFFTLNGLKVGSGLFVLGMCFRSSNKHQEHQWLIHDFSHCIAWFWSLIWQMTWCVQWQFWPFVIKKMIYYNLYFLAACLGFKNLGILEWMCVLYPSKKGSCHSHPPHFLRFSHTRIQWRVFWCSFLCRIMRINFSGISKKSVRLDCRWCKCRLDMISFPFFFPF